MTETILGLENISKVVNHKNKEKTILKNIDLDIYKNKTLGIIGPTGSGKTTLLRILNMIDEPTSGHIKYKNKVVTSNSLDYRRKIAMVFQKPIVFKGDVFDNVYYGLKIRGYKKGECESEILKYLDLVNLTGYEHQKASTLSGGETQRLALARTLILKPEILLLDEPTANLDPNSTLQIEEIIKNIQKNTETTLIISTHNLIQGLNLCDEIVLLNKEIIQRSPSKELFKKPKNKFVAEFLGIKNIKKGLITPEESLTNIKIDSINIKTDESTTKKESYLYIRSDEILVCREQNQNACAENQIKGTITQIIDLNTTIEIKVDAGIEFKIDLTRNFFSDHKFNVGDEVWLQFKTSDVHLLND